MYMFGVLMCCFTVIACVIAKTKYASLDLTLYLMKWRTFLFRFSKRLMWIIKGFCFFSFFQIVYLFLSLTRIFHSYVYHCKAVMRFNKWIELNMETPSLLKGCKIVHARWPWPVSRESSLAWRASSAVTRDIRFFSFNSRDSRHPHHLQSVCHLNCNYLF